MPDLPDPLLVLLALLATLACYTVIVLYDVKGTPLDTLEAALLLEVGALAGVSARRVQR